MSKIETSDGVEFNSKFKAKDGTPFDSFTEAMDYSVDILKMTTDEAESSIEEVWDEKKTPIADKERWCDEHPESKECIEHRKRIHSQTETEEVPFEEEPLDESEEKGEIVYSQAELQEKFKQEVKEKVLKDYGSQVENMSSEELESIIKLSMAQEILKLSRTTLAEKDPTEGKVKENLEDNKGNEKAEER